MDWRRRNPYALKTRVLPVPMGAGGFATNLRDALTYVSHFARQLDSANVVITNVDIDRVNDRYTGRVTVRRGGK